MNLTKEILARNNDIYSEKIILQWKSCEIKKKELISNILEVGFFFKKLKFSPNSRIILLLNDTPAIFEYFYGAVAVGLIPIFINPRIKLDELSFLIKDSDCKIIVMEYENKELIDKLSINNRDIKIIIQDKYLESATHNEKYIENNNIIYTPQYSENTSTLDNFIFYDRNEDDMCFWQYTSGTTGTPTAVVHSAKSVRVIAEELAVKHLALNNNDIVYSTSKVFFGYGFGNTIIFPLWVNAKVFIDSLWPTAERIINNIHNICPTIVFGVPKIYGMILESKIKFQIHENLRLFYSGGAHLSSSLNEKWYNITGKYITQGLGSTEIGHVYISNNITNPNIGVTGKPVNTFNIKILNENGVDIKIGEIGEVYIQPPYKLLGYWNSSKKVNGFLSNNWFKSGDTCTIDSDGNIKYISRSDNLFKIKGRFVDPNNIEEIILDNTNFNEVYFIGVENMNTYDIDTYLCVCLPKGSNESDKNKYKKEIYNLLENRIKSYTKPSKILFFNDFGFAYNGNGKVNRNMIANKIKLLENK